jgi:hypothetical protein
MLAEAVAQGKLSPAELAQRRIVAEALDLGELTDIVLAELLKASA